MPCYPRIVLLDECLSHTMVTSFPSSSGFTVHHPSLLGWLGKTNGELRDAAVEVGMEVIITKDKGFHRKLGVRPLPFPVLLLNPAPAQPRLEDYIALIPQIIDDLTAGLEVEHYYYGAYDQDIDGEYRPPPETEEEASQ